MLLLFLLSRNNVIRIWRMHHRQAPARPCPYQPIPFSQVHQYGESSKFGAKSSELEATRPILVYGNTTSPSELDIYSAYPSVEKLLCKLYELCDVLPVSFAFRPQRVRQRGQLVVRLHRHHHHHRHQSQPQLGALVSDRDPSVLIARQLSPLPESEQTLSDHRPSQHHRVVTVASLGGNSLINTETLRRQEWYLRKCYAKELRIIQGKGPSTNTMEDRAARVGTPASFADGPVVTGGTEERAPSRVRVHFFESGAVKCPSATGGSSAAMDVSVDGQLFNGNASNSYFRETQQTQQHVFTTSTPNGTSVRTVTYTARQSTDSGIDNPFRPEGELSLEADEIVKAIKEGRPIDSIDSGRISRQELGTTTLSINTSAVPENKSPTNVKNGAAKNGSAKGPSNKKDAKPGVVDVQRGVVVPPSEAQQAEQVVIKKKPRCKCCVIQ